MYYKKTLQRPNLLILNYKVIIFYNILHNTTDIIELHRNQQSNAMKAVYHRSTASWVAKGYCHLVNIVYKPAYNSHKMPEYSLSSNIVW